MSEEAKRHESGEYAGLSAVYGHSCYCRGTMDCSKNKETEKTREGCIHWGRSQRPRTSAQVRVQYGGTPPREAESEGGSAPEPRLMETPQLLPIELTSRTLKGEHTDRARKEGRTGRSGTR